MLPAQPHLGSKTLIVWSCRGRRNWGKTGLDVTIFWCPFTPGKPKVRVHKCPTLTLPCIPLHQREPVAQVMIEFLLPSPPHWTSPGHEGVFGSWGAPPKLVPPAIALDSATTSTHPSPPQQGHSPWGLDDSPSNQLLFPGRDSWPCTSEMPHRTHGAATSQEKQAGYELS